MEIYKKIESAFKRYQGEKEIIGQSECGRNLFAFFVGKKGGKVGICQYAIHAREWVTSLLALKHVEYSLTFGGAWIIPLMNPDGAELCLNSLSSVKEQGRREFLKRLNGGENFSLWKANANGVDLNVNFDAGWGRGEKNSFHAGSENYIGPSPFSERETRALERFTKEVSPDYTVSYHTAGEEIYWQYKQTGKRAARDKKLASLLSKSTGYPLGNAGNSHGGYKDWCILRLKIPSFTIEVGSGVQPLGRKALSDILAKNGRSINDLSFAISEEK